ncbi:MAG: HepT-like ribonuclease domain-containing protein [Burkholderiaceae bacterium]
MADFCEKVMNYTQGLDHEAFVNDGLKYDATLRNLELIGEAATHVPEAVRSAEAGIPWRKLIATRNRLIHAYLGIDDDIVWSIVQDDVPVLLQQLSKLRSRL